MVPADRNDSLDQPAPDAPSGPTDDLGMPGGASAVVNAFLDRFLDDREEGIDRSCADYQAMWPGFESVIARQHHAITTAKALSSVDSPAKSDEPIEIGPYRILKVIGRGGQGTVYAATDTRLDRVVALKVLSGVPGDPSKSARFRREAEVASQIENPGICTVLDADLEAAIPYVAMQWVPGETLEALLSRTRAAADPESSEREPLPVGPTSAKELGTVLSFLADAADAVHDAHEVGIVHRDFKPGNVMVHPDGRAVLLDFGLAAVLTDDTPTLTRTGDIFGTPAYMAPEQVRGVRVDRRADVYAIAVTLFECVTLRLPFVMATREALYREILTLDPPDPRRYNPIVPLDLKVVLDRALEKDPERRYASARDFAQDLRAIRDTRPITARPVTAWTRIDRWRRREPAKAALVLAAAIISVFAGFTAAKLGELRVAREEKRAIERASAVETALGDGFIELETAQLSDAEDAFRRAIEHDRDSPVAVVGLVIAHTRAGENEDALAILEEFKDVVERHPDLDRCRSLIFSAEGRVKEATALDEQLGAPRGQLALFIEGLRRTDERLPADHPDLAEASQLLTRAILLSPSPRALYHMQRLIVSSCRGDSVRILEDAEVLETFWPDQRVAWYRIGYALMTLDPPRALAALQRATEIDPEYAPPYGPLAVLHLAAKEPTRALEMARRAIELEPDLAATHYQLGNVLLRLGENAEAISALERAIQIDPEHASALSDLGLAILKTQGPAAATGTLRRAVAADPSLSAGWANLGVALGYQDQDSESRECFERAIEISPESNAAHAGLSAVLSRGQDYENLIVELRRRLSVTDDPIAAMRLADLLVDEGVDPALHNPAEAVTLARRALDLIGSVPAHYVLTRAFSANGQPDEARKVAAEALALIDSSDESTWRNKFAELLDRLSEDPIHN